MPLNNKRKARVLTGVTVHEISAVDKGAGVGTKIVLRKSAQRDAAFAKSTRRLAMSVKSILAYPDCDRDGMLAKTFAQYQDHLNTLMKRYPKTANLDVSVGEAAPDEGMPDRDDDADETERLSADADDDEKEKEAMTRKLKSLDAVQICKQMVDEEHAFAMSEHELVNLIDGYAKAHGSSFAKMFTAQDDTGLALRKAVDIAKGGWSVIKRRESLSKVAPSSPHYLADGAVPTMLPGKATLKPRSSGVSGKPAQQGVNNPRLSIDQLQALIDAQRAEADEDEGGEAYEKLCKLAADMQAERPELTFEKCFEKIYTSREHRSLAEAERKANRPRA